jgi:polar amino acid transport system substrate-binding protein
MKKVLALVLALILCLSFAACSQTEPESSATESAPEESAAPSESEAVSEAPAEITTVAAGKLTVATSPDFAPYEFYSVDEAGNLTLSGFDMALAQAIADHLGLELEVVPMDFDSILLELQAGNVDLGIAGFSPDPERAETFDFSDLYYIGGQSLVTLAENKDVYNTFESLTGKSVGAQTGSIQMDLAEQYTPDAAPEREQVALAWLTEKGW